MFYTVIYLALRYGRITRGYRTSTYTRVHRDRADPRDRRGMWVLEYMTLLYNESYTRRRARTPRGGALIVSAHTYGAIIHACMHASMHACR